MQEVQFRDLGKIEYQQAWDLQQTLLGELVERKRANLVREKKGEQIVPQEHFLLFCEHPHVYTLGKSGSLDNLLLSEEQLANREIGFFKINRGGDITYHGPGQIVGYPIFDLDCFFTDVHKYVRFIEEAIIRTISEYGLEGIRMKGYTGVWLEADEKGPQRKICAIGVHLSRWVTMHGFAFNVNTDLSLFQNIIPCGIAEDDKTVTSLAREVGRELDMTRVKEKVKTHFADLFGYSYV